MFHSQGGVDRWRERIARRFLGTRFVDPFVRGYCMFFGIVLALPFAESKQSEPLWVLSLNAVAGVLVATSPWWPLACTFGFTLVAFLLFPFADGLTFSILGAQQVVLAPLAVDRRWRALAFVGSLNVVLVVLLQFDPSRGVDSLVTTLFLNLALMAGTAMALYMVQRRFERMSEAAVAAERARHEQVEAARQKVIADTHDVISFGFNGAIHALRHSRGGVELDSRSRVDNAETSALVAETILVSAESEFSDVLTALESGSPATSVDFVAAIENWRSDVESVLTSTHISVEWSVPVESITTTRRFALDVRMLLQELVTNHLVHDGSAACSMNIAVDRIHSRIVIVYSAMSPGDVPESGPECSKSIARRMALLDGEISSSFVDGKRALNLVVPIVDAET